MKKNYFHADGENPAGDSGFTEDNGLVDRENLQAIQSFVNKGGGGGHDGKKCKCKEKGKGGAKDPGKTFSWNKTTVIYMSAAAVLGVIIGKII